MHIIDQYWSADKHEEICKILADSLQFSCHKVITTYGDEELLAVQMTRNTLNLLIELLRKET